MNPAGVAPSHLRRDWLPYAVGGITVAVLVGFLLYPIGMTLLSSFVPNGQPIALANLSLVNFRTLFAGAMFQDAVVHSIVVSLLATGISVALALPAAYAFARVAMPFRTLILALMVIPIIAPPFIGAYSWIILLGKRGVATHFLNAWLGIELPSIYGLFGIVLALSLSFFPYIFLFVQGALSAADPHIEEGARIMGASRWRIMRTVTFPLVAPTIGAGILIVFVKALGNFGVPAILGGEYYVLPTLIYYQIHGYFDLNAASAIALVNVAIMGVAIFILGRMSRHGRFVTVTGVTRRAARHDSIGARLLANAYVWGLLLLALLPQLVTLFTSFAERWGGTLLPTKYGLANYVRVFDKLSEPILNSLILGGIATAVCLCFGTLAAYTAVRRRFVGKWALDLTIMLPFIIPGIVTGVAFLATFNSGWIVLSGTGTIIVLAYFVRRVAFVFRSVSAAVGQVDNKMEEASTICGATWGRTMVKVTIPLIAPGILAGGILVFSTLLSELSVTVILYSARWKTISIAILEQLTSDDVISASTIGAVAIFITLILVFAASKLSGKAMAEMFR